MRRATRHPSFHSSLHFNGGTWRSKVAAQSTGFRAHASARETNTGLRVLLPGSGLPVCRGGSRARVACFQSPGLATNLEMSFPDGNGGTLRARTRERSACVGICRLVTRQPASNSGKCSAKRRGNRGETAPRVHALTSDRGALPWSEKGTPCSSGFCCSWPCCSCCPP